MDLLREEMRIGEEINRREVGPLEIELVIDVDDVDTPLLVVPLGDLHAGSGATQWDKVVEYVEMLCRIPGVIVIGTGDWIEGIETKHGVDMVQNTIALNKQVEAVRNDVAGPLVNAGKLKACVRRHKAHEGHLMKSVGDDMWDRILEGYDVQQVANGGMVKICLRGKDGREKRMKVQVFHNTPGGSGKNVLRPLERIAADYSPVNVPDLILAAHDHRGGTEGGANTVLVRGGTPKGNRNNPDPYGITLGLPGTDPFGQMIVAWTDGAERGRDFELWPAIEPKTGMAVLGAMRLWERLSRQGLLDETLESIHHRDGATGSAKFIPNDSIVSKGGLVSDSLDGREPEYEVAAWEVNTSLAIGVMSIASLRFGSRTHDERQEPWLVDRLSRPDMYSILGRQAVDRKIPSSVERREWLDAVTDFMGNGRGRVLGVLYDAVFKNTQWLKAIRIDDETSIDPVNAVSETARALETVIVEHMRTIEVRVGGDNKIAYPITVMDDLEGRGAMDSALSGLLSVYDHRLDIKPAVLMGGHVPKMGAGQYVRINNPHTRFPVFVSPGWGAVRANWRQNNRPESNADPLGAGVILLPGKLGGELSVVPVARKEQWDMLDALHLLIAANKGWIDPVKLTSRK